MDNTTTILYDAQRIAREAVAHGWLIPPGPSDCDPVREKKLAVQRRCMRQLRERQKVQRRMQFLAEQDELKFASRRLISRETVEAMISILKTSPGWLSARLLAGRMGVSDRVVRLAAEYACPQVISGNEGYMHTDNATDADLHEFCGRMESQARRMLERVAKVRAYVNESRHV